MKNVRNQLKFHKFAPQINNMNGFLFHQIVFGPVISRRLGVSLGINLLPVNAKICTFDCIYCECGFNEKQVGNREKPSKAMVMRAIEEKLLIMKETNDPPDSITFAGNGEPTLHPEFPQIVESLITLRDQMFPAAAISVLSNGSTLNQPEIFNTLLKINNNILKLDAGSEDTFRKLNRYQGTSTLNDFVNNLCRFKGRLIIQSMFVRGEYQGEIIDNTSPTELELWLKHINNIKPKSVMIYSIARPTPAQNLTKIHRKELMHIAQMVTDLGIDAEAF